MEIEEKRLKKFLVKKEDDFTKETIGMVVYEKILRNGMSIKQFAKEIGISDATIRTWIYKKNTDNITKKMLLQFCQYFDCQPGEIFPVYQENETDKITLENKKYEEDCIIINIKEIAKIKNISIKEIMNKVGMTEQRITQYTQNTIKGIRNDEIRNLQKVLNVNVNDLISYHKKY